MCTKYVAYLLKCSISLWLVSYDMNNLCVVSLVCHALVSYMMIIITLCLKGYGIHPQLGCFCCAPPIYIYCEIASRLTEEGQLPRNVKMGVLS